MLCVESTCQGLSSVSLADEVTAVATPRTPDLEQVHASGDVDNETSSMSEPSSQRRGWENDDWGQEWGPVDEVEDEVKDEASKVKEIEREVRHGWPTRDKACRYRDVVVVHISWREHDLGSGISESHAQYRTMFEELYNFEVWRFLIPRTKPHLALGAELVELAKRDSPSSLFIIWYDGHGLEHEDRMGSPRWASHLDPKRCVTVDTSVISSTLADCEADILLVNNACCSLTYNRFRTKGVVECISASAFNTITYGSANPEDPSLSLTWAALKILRERSSLEDGISVPELHRRICQAVQWGTEETPGLIGHMDMNITWEETNTRTQPVYTRLSAAVPGPFGRTRSIVLGRLGHYSERCWMSSWETARMTIELGLDDGAAIDTREWTDWILSAPANVGFVSLKWEPAREEEDEW